MSKLEQKEENGIVAAGELQCNARHTGPEGPTPGAEMKQNILLNTKSQRNEIIQYER